MAQTRFDVHDARAISLAYESGATSYELAARYGCSRTAITNAIRRVGGKPRRGGFAKGRPLLAKRMFTPAQDTEIAEAYGRGESTIELARNYKCDASTIAGAVRRAGRKLRKGGPRGKPSWRRKFTAEQDRAIASEYVSGRSTVHLAKERGVGVGAIKGAIRRAGGRVRTLKEARHLRRARPRRFTEEQDRALRLEYEGGASMPALARRHGCGETAIVLALRRAGATPRPHVDAHPPMFNVQQSLSIASEYSEGVPIYKLARKYRCSDPAIRSAILRGGGRILTQAEATARRLEASKQFTTEQERGIAIEYAQGANVSMLAAKHFSSERAIARAIRRAGGVLRRGGTVRGSKGKSRLFRQEQQMAIKAAYEGGVSVDELATDHHCSTDAIRRAVRRAGGELRSRQVAAARRRAVPERLIPFLRDEYLGGESISGLGEKHRLGTYAIRTALVGAGVPIRPPGERTPQMLARLRAVHNTEKARALVSARMQERYRLGKGPAPKYVNTLPERTLVGAIEALGIKIDEKPPPPGAHPLELLEPGLPGGHVSYDMRIGNVFIFVDGCRFHSCPGYRGSFTDAWRKSLERTRRRDKEVGEFFNHSQDYRMVRIWEHQLVRTPRTQHAATTPNPREAARCIAAYCQMIQASPGEAPRE